MTFFISKIFFCLFFKWQIKKNHFKAAKFKQGQILTVVLIQGVQGYIHTYEIQPPEGSQGQNSFPVKLVILIFFSCFQLSNASGIKENLFPPSLTLHHTANSSLLSWQRKQPSYEWLTPNINSAFIHRDAQHDTQETFQTTTEFQKKQSDCHKTSQKKRRSFSGTRGSFCIG